MNKARKQLSVITVIGIMSIVLMACGSKSGNSAVALEPSSSVSAIPSSTASSSSGSEAEQSISSSRIFKDWTGHEVEVPVQPQRVIYHGETTGDLLALGVKPIGISRMMIEGSVFEDELKDAEDMGFPLSPEKALTLNTDLIIFSNSDETQYAQISKVAPTVTFDTFAPLEERMRVLGDLLDKKQEAEAWITQHQLKTTEMWEKLRASGVKEGETASVFTMYPGNRLFVMAVAGLPQVLYDKQGFKPTARIQEILDQDKGFVEISAELLPEYAGDRIFILNPVAEEAKQSTSELLKSQIWLKLPAVVNKQVYEFDLLKGASDATSREWLLEELPKAFNQ
jgi:iron complex transport system substrate-binding protein